MWLMAQASDRGWEEMGYVAGFRTWLSLGRHVRKGEKALRVLAPCRYKSTNQDTGEESWRLGGFKVESVFASGQTDGDGDIPERMRPELLTGEGPAGAWDALATLVEAEGYTIARAPLAPANGTTSFVSKVVTVADRLEGAAAVKTLVHELAHVLLHVNVDYHGNRGRCECEAESVAYLVCGELGLTTDAYSFAYVTTWADGDAKVVMSAADAAKKCATRILEALAEPARELVPV